MPVLKTEQHLKKFEYSYVLNKLILHCSLFLHLNFYSNIANLFIKKICKENSNVLSTNSIIHQNFGSKLWEFDRVDLQCTSDINI